MPRLLHFQVNTIQQHKYENKYYEKMSINQTKSITSTTTTSRRRCRSLFAPFLNFYLCALKFFEFCNNCRNNFAKQLQNNRLHIEAVHVSSISDDENGGAKYKQDEIERVPC